jgi:hypothetical protein
MQMARINDMREEFLRMQLVLVVCALGGLFIAGCAHEREFSGTQQRALATPPAFFTGPMALVLTNSMSYHAQIIFESPTPWGSTQTVRGDLTSAGSKLAFRPESPKASRQNTQGTLVFVWDTTQRSGYALNDALQGYAPYSGNAQFTNVVANKEGSATEKIAGHECQRESAMVFGDDGSTHSLQVWRAVDLHGFPVRISGGSNAPAGVLTITKLQFGLPAQFLMSQEGFTKYDSPDAMVTELVARQHSISRKEGSTYGYPENIERSRVGQSY